MYYFISEIFAVLNTLLKPKQNKGKKARKLKSHKLLSSKKSFHESWLAKTSNRMGRGKNEESATATSANTLRSVQPHP